MAVARQRKGQPTFLSLFSGCGGLDLPFHALGYKCIGAYDSNPIAVETYNANFGRFAQQFDLSTAYPTVSEFPDILLAGPPCQGFSTAGARKPDDPRNLLIGRTIDFAQKIKPRVIVLENVPAILSGPSRDHWVRAAARLKRSGYTVRSELLSGIDLGLCQTRKRLFMLAWNSSSEHLALNSIQAVSPPTLGQVLARLSGTENHQPKVLPPTSLQGMIARRVGAGQRLCDVRESTSTIHSWDIPEIFGRTSLIERKVLMAVLRLRRRARVRDFGDGDPVSVARIEQFVGSRCQSLVNSLAAKRYLRVSNGAVEFQRTFNGKYRRAKKDGVSSTVDTHFGDPSLFLHPVEHRGFTVREGARIQSFPDSFIFGGSTRMQFRLVGNAVPPVMAQQIASWTKHLLS